MLIFGNDKHARGCYIELSKLAGATSMGAVFSAGGGGAGGGGIGTEGMASSANGSATAPCFISAVSIKQVEKFNIVQCFGDRNYTYAFGHDATASLMEITFTCFLVDPSGNSFGLSLGTLMKTYAARRLSKQPELATLTIGSCSVQGFWVGMGSGTMNAEYNLQTFTAQLILVSAQDGAGSSESGSSSSASASSASGASGSTFPGLGSRSYMPAPPFASLPGTNGSFSLRGTAPISSLYGNQGLAGTGGNFRLFL